MKDPLKPIDQHVELVLKCQTEEILEVLIEVFFELLVKVRSQLLELIVFSVFKILSYLKWVVFIFFGLELLLILSDEVLEFLPVFFQKLLSSFRVLLVVLRLPLIKCFLMLSVVEPPALLVKELVHLDKVMLVFSFRFVVSYLRFCLRRSSFFRFLSLPGHKRHDVSGNRRHR